jgi:hypothetical protein
MTLRKGKRKLSKTKTYGFNPWLDQIDSINALIYRHGEKESTILRKLVDEALTARKQKDHQALRQDVFLQDLGDELDGIKDSLDDIKLVIVKLVERLEGKAQK